MTNYTVAPEVLAKYVPFGTELDLWESKCYVSLVGFMFLNTKLMGLSIPFHSDFEEVNLRFYVKRFDGTEWKRGVVFIKEIVRKPALTFIANVVYNENYETLAMRHEITEHSQNRTVEYGWKKNNRWNSIKVYTDLEATEIAAGSEAEFITEHYWGYAHVDSNSCNEYEVTHPKWKQYKVMDYEIDVDFGAVYGKEFESLNNQAPSSVFLAEGSEITVEGKTKLT